MKPKRGFSEFRGHGKESIAPDPEQCARTAQNDRSGNANDVANANGRRERREKGLQRAERSTFSGLAALESLAKGVWKSQDLHEAETYGEKQSRQHQHEYDPGHHEVGGALDERIKLSH
jgi:hypothetical protein